MKTIIKATLPIFLVVIILTSCNGPVSPTMTSQTVAVETGVSKSLTDIAETQVVVPTISLTAPLPTALPSTTPEIILTPSITNEEISFWENVGPMPSNVSVIEHALPSSINPTKNDGLNHLFPTKVKTDTKVVPSSTPHQITTKELGYETRSIYTSWGTVSGFQLYRDGRLLFDNLVHVSKVYTFSTNTGPITAFVVETEIKNLGRQRYVVQNDAIYFLGASSIDDIGMFHPILYKGELLWASIYSDHTEVKKSNGVVILTIPSNWMVRHRFFIWNGHWILEADDTVAVDGEILNKKFGYEEVFRWSVVKDKPTYFFRKGSRVGLSHDGQILPISYQNVAHNLCCSPAQNNPSMGNNLIHFFGERDGVWYYVEVKFK